MRERRIRVLVALILLVAFGAPAVAGGLREAYEEVGEPSREAPREPAAAESRATDPPAGRPGGGQTADTSSRAAGRSEDEGTPDEASVALQRVAPTVTISHSPVAMNVYQRALRAYLKRDFERAERLGLEALQIEPSCIEAKWLMACIYEKTGDLGLLLEYAGELGIREARESAYISGLVAEGSKGYVLSRRDEYATVDLTAADGIREGVRLVVYEEGNILRHPVTLEIVDVDQPERGTLQVVQTYDTHSIARVLRGAGVVERGMRVIPEEAYDRFSFDEEGDGVVVRDQSLTQRDAGPSFRAISLSGTYGGLELAGPEGFWIDSDGSIFIADTGNDRIIKLSSAARFLSAFGDSGSGLRQFRGPVSLCRIRDDLAVVERMNHRLHLLDPESLNHEGIVGSRGIGAPGRFTTPQKAVAAEDRLFVLDSGNRRIQVVDADGSILQETVDDPALSETPVSFTVLEDQIVVLDTVSAELHRFSLRAPYRYQGATPLPEALAGTSIVDVTGYSSAEGERLVFVLDGEARIVVTEADTLSVLKTIGSPGSGRGEFSEPVQAVVIDDVLHVLERENLRIQVISGFL